ncbi:MAG: hypothetical protein R6W97_05405 [Thiobacillus sp.]
MDISDVVIHVNESLDAQARHDLEDRMRDIDGVIAPRFNGRARHLMIVAYNPEQTGAGFLLDAVRNQGYTAQACGGMSV